MPYENTCTLHVDFLYEMFYLTVHKSCSVYVSLSSVKVTGLYCGPFVSLKFLSHLCDNGGESVK